MTLLGRASAMLRERKILANCVAGGLLASVADGCTQMIEQRHLHRQAGSGRSAEVAKGKLADLSPERRLSSMIVYGSVMGGAFRVWYGHLDRWFDRLAPKLLFHQCLVSPFFNFVFLCYVELVREPFDGTLALRMQERVEADWFYLTSRSFPFWMTINTMNFYFTPVRWQAIVMSVVNCCWIVPLWFAQVIR
eukprot:gnl/TRDRNA2_/TRDRNA2_164642_c0_seq2.p1 gnl/TRDRNA2_/TRDRNA2_164642_c0~~gnl/TRDRNA2_/TRDRNA2_164642_c0_seq2.p1  ORF type:complete len:192 (+),score=21.72 gnl/TRDRNA2_/TRDRNA2_164642_c0_seq2:123-698(+)